MSFFGEDYHSTREYCRFCEDRVGTKDRRKSLSVNYETGQYQCFRCGAKPSETGNVFGKKNFFKKPLKDSFNILDYLFPEKEKPECLDIERISMPIDPVTTPNAFRYLIDRHFTVEEIAYYNLRLGISYLDDMGKLSNKWLHRIIFPFFENGKVTYCIGRSIYGWNPKYINSKGKKRYILWGLDEVRDQAIICEGIISAIAARRATGIPAVALLGKTISDWQISKLKAKTNNVWLSLDGDVNITQVVSQLLNADFEIHIIKLPGDKDPDEVHPLEYQKHFQTARKATYADAVNNNSIFY